MHRSSPATVEATVRQIALKNLDRVEAFPTLSDTAFHVMGIANRDDVSVAEVASIVRRDGVLAMRVLRTANSCAFRGRTEVEDIQQAVLRMGLQQCTQLLGAMELRGVYERYEPAIRERCDTLLRHSLFVARLASGLARLATVCSSGQAFTSGLLHDIGRIVLCANCGITNSPEIREDDNSLAVERSTYGIDHSALGYQFVTHNGLPESVARVTLNHHRPEQESTHRSLVALVAVTERITNHIQQNRNITGYNLDTCPSFEVLTRNWSRSRKHTFQTGLASATVQAMRDTRRMLKSITPK